MPPRRGYSYTDSELARMQQDAIARAREMHSRAHRADGEAPPPVPPPRNTRGWNTSPGAQRRTQQRQGSPRGQRPGQEHVPPPQPEYTPEPEPAAAPAGNTTVIEDLMGKLGLDEDRLLIIGLLFILINAKADVTIILALIYLLL